MNGATCQGGEKTAINLIPASTTLHVEWSKEINSHIGKRLIVRGEAFLRQVGYQLFHRRFVSFPIIDTPSQNMVQQCSCLNNPDT